MFHGAIRPLVTGWESKGVQGFVMFFVWYPDTPKMTLNKSIDIFKNDYSVN